MDTETGLAEEKKDERSRLVGLVREIERFLSDGLVKVVKRKNAELKYYYLTKSQERLEIDTLGDAGILKHTKKFFTTIIKLKTKLL